MKDVLLSILLPLLSGGVGVALIKIIGDKIAFKRERKAKKDDEASLDFEGRLKSIETKTDAQSAALRFLLYDRIRYLGQAYIKEGCIDFDDRRILNEMHSAYHNGLNGNGDLDTLMSEVNKLPLKIH